MEHLGSILHTERGGPGEANLPKVSLSPCLTHHLAKPHLCSCRCSVLTPPLQPSARLWRTGCPCTTSTRRLLGSWPPCSRAPSSRSRRAGCPRHCNCVWAERWRSAPLLRCAAGHADACPEPAAAVACTLTTAMFVTGCPAATASSPCRAPLKLGMCRCHLPISFPCPLFCTPLPSLSFFSPLSPTANHHRLSANQERARQTGMRGSSPALTGPPCPRRSLGHSHSLVQLLRSFRAGRHRRQR